MSERDERMYIETQEELSLDSIAARLRVQARDLGRLASALECRSAEEAETSSTDRHPEAWLYEYEDGSGGVTLLPSQADYLEREHGARLTPLYVRAPTEEPEGQHTSSDEDTCPECGQAPEYVDESGYICPSGHQWSRFSKGREEEPEVVAKIKEAAEKAAWILEHGASNEDRVAETVLTIFRLLRAPEQGEPVAWKYRCRPVESDYWSDYRLSFQQPTPSDPERWEYEIIPLDARAPTDGEVLAKKVRGLLIEADSSMSWMLHRRREEWDENEIRGLIGRIRRLLRDPDSSEEG